MSEAEKLEFLRTLVGPDDPNAVLEIYLRRAALAVLQRRFPFDETVTEVPERYAIIQCEIAEYLMNKRGAEGQTSHSENGIGRSYESGDVPPSLLSRITPMAGLPQ